VSLKQHKYLHSNGHTVVLINCKLYPDHLICGAAYFTSGLPKNMPICSLSGEKICLIVVPETIRKNPTFTRLLSPQDDIRIEYAEPLGNP
jgi:hypothetical protein